MEDDEFFIDAIIREPLRDLAWAAFADHLESCGDTLADSIRMFDGFSRYRRRMLAGAMEPLRDHFGFRSARALLVLMLRRWDWAFATMDDRVARRVHLYVAVDCQSDRYARWLTFDKSVRFGHPQLAANYVSQALDYLEEHSLQELSERWPWRYRRE